MLVDMHGASLQAESEGVGKGASFILEFAAVERGTAPESAADLPAASDRRRLLLVEDHATTAALMARLLRKRGHEVVLAHTKADAVAFGLDQRFDIVISDLGLPDGNGYEVMEALRKSPGVVGIALSGYGMDADVALSAKAGFQFHLTKPVDAQKLYQTIEQIASAQRA
ncbi:MAG TPA: response regulator [Chthoniobacterales bacterium]|nr:response regulator [Chthoniobacterales bacterium]